MKADILIALSIIMSINIFLFLGQTAINNINPGANQFYNYDDSFISSFDSGNYTVNENLVNNIPGGSTSVSPETGNIFTDTWTTLKNWLSETTGFKYLKAIVNAVPNFLKIIGVPSEFAYALGVLWHGVTFLLIIIFIKE